MYAQAQLEAVNAPQEMTLDDTHEVRGAGLFADIGAVIDSVIPLVGQVISKVS